MSGDFLPRPNDEVGGGVVGQIIQPEPTPSTPAQPLVERVPSLLRPLRNRNYALLFTGQLCSLSATSSTWSHSHSWSWATPACGSWAWS